MIRGRFALDRDRGRPHVRAGVDKRSWTHVTVLRFMPDDEAEFTRQRDLWRRLRSQRVASLLDDWWGDADADGFAGGLVVERGRRFAAVDDAESEPKRRLQGAAAVLLFLARDHGLGVAPGRLADSLELFPGGCWRLSRVGALAPAADLAAAAAPDALDFELRAVAAREQSLLAQPAPAPHSLPGLLLELLLLHPAFGELRSLEQVRALAAQDLDAEVAGKRDRRVVALLRALAAEPVVGREVERRAAAVLR